MKEQNTDALNEGRSISSGDTWKRPAAKSTRRLPPLNEGRSISSGDTTEALLDHYAGNQVAQRRPEHKLRRHMSNTYCLTNMDVIRSTKAGA